MTSVRFVPGFVLVCFVVSKLKNRERIFQVVVTVNRRNATRRTSRMAFLRNALKISLNGSDFSASAGRLTSVRYASQQVTRQVAQDWAGRETGLGGAGRL